MKDILWSLVVVGAVIGIVVGLVWTAQRGEAGPWCVTDRTNGQQWTTMGLHFFAGGISFAVGEERIVLRQNHSYRPGACR